MPAHRWQCNQTGNRGKLTSPRGALFLIGLDHSCPTLEAETTALAASSAVSNDPSPRCLPLILARDRAWNLPLDVLVTPLKPLFVPNLRSGLRSTSSTAAGAVILPLRDGTLTASTTRLHASEIVFPQNR